MADLLYIYPDFLLEFQCIGSDCMNTCCEGWDVKVDEYTAEYYERLGGTFGDFLRQHVVRDEITNKITAIKMEEGNRCPFLNEEGLCRIQLTCGSEHLGHVCQNYPRIEHGSSNIALLVVVTSCDAILDILYNRMQPVWLCTAGKKAHISTADDYKAMELSQFIAWGMELLQDEAVPFGTALATVLHVALESENAFDQNDFQAIDSNIVRAPEIQAQFLQAVQELDKEETSRAAWKFILGVIEAFCQIISQKKKDPKWDTILWKPEMFDQSNEERLRNICANWHNDRKDERKISFLRRYSAVCLLYHSSSVPASEYLFNMCMTMILAAILPLTWENTENLSRREYLTRLSFLSRWFEQKSDVAEQLKRAVDNVFSPDFFTYVIALMELFG